MLCTFDTTAFVKIFYPEDVINNLIEGRCVLVFTFNVSGSLAEHSRPRYFRRLPCGPVAGRHSGCWRAFGFSINTLHDGWGMVLLNYLFCG